MIARGHQAKTGYWGEQGGGMMLFIAADLEEAETIVAQDPLIQNGCVNDHGCVNDQAHEWRIVVE